MLKLRRRKTGEWTDIPEHSYRTGCFTIPDLIDNMLIEGLGKHKNAPSLEKEREEELTGDGMEMSTSIKLPNSLAH